MESYSIFKNYTPEKKIENAHPPVADFCLINTSVLPEDALCLVGPHTYRLKGHKDNPRIFVTGCGGESLGQHQVALLMDLVAEQEGAPDFVLVLGDNIYENGADSPNDPAFNTFFHDVYPILLHMQEVPYYVILGNHDGKYHKKASLTKKLTSNIKQGREVEKNEVIHTYVSDAYGSTQEKIHQYSQPELNLKNSQPWNMPHFFYSLIIGEVQLFCINSNSYPKDYLTLISDHPDKNNQAVWLLTEYRKAKNSGRKMLLALHHPFHTEGKRADPQEFDAYQYLSSEEIKNLNFYLGTNTESYNELLKQIFIYQEMHFDMILAAHDHYLSYFNNQADVNADYKICQLKTGGGGGKLQKRTSAKDHPYVGCCLENHGFAAISFTSASPNLFEIDIYSTKDHHIKFTHHNHIAVQLACDNEEVSLIQDYVLKACHEYLFLLKQEELQENALVETPLIHRNNYSALFSYVVTSVSAWMKYIRPYPIKIHEMAVADDLLAYFTQVKLPRLDQIYDYIIQAIDIEKLKAIFAYLKKYENDKMIDLSFESSFFFLLFQKLVSIPDGIGDKIKNRWQQVIENPIKNTQIITQI